MPRFLAAVALLTVGASWPSAGHAAAPVVGSSAGLTRGLHRVETADAMRPMEMAVGVSGEFFNARDLFATGDTNSYHAERLVLALSLIEGLELGASWSMVSNENDAYDPASAQALGDPRTSLKLTLASGDLRVGALLTAFVPTSPQGNGLKPAAMAISGAAVGSYHLGRAVVLAANLGYRVDRTRELFKRDITAAQQFTAGVSRVDALTYGLGGAAVHDFGPSVALGGFLEVTGDFAASAGFDESPLRATVGAKALLLEHHRLELALGADLRLAGAPNEAGNFPGLPPWQAFARLVAHLDPLGIPGSPTPLVVESEPEPPPPPPAPEPPKPFELAGVVLDKATGKGIAGATVELPGLASPLTTDASGAFRSPPLPIDEGLLQLKLAAEGYHPGEHTMAKGPAGGVAKVELALVAIGKTTPGVLRGILKDARTGAAVRGAVFLPALKRRLDVGADGAFTAELKPGRYQVNITSPRHQAQSKDIEISAGDVVILNIDLTPKR